LDPSFLETVLPQFTDDARRNAERICSHEFDIFGERADFGQEIDWHLDPKTGNRWPKKFWGDINYRDGRTVGGIKFAWELNRLHHLPQLALASTLTGDEKYEREIFDQLRSWLDSNPYPFGINWISGIELGIRLVNLVYALKFLRHAPVGRDHDTVTEFVHRHATHLMRYPSKYSSSANHALAEALGLFVAGISFPGLRASSKWKKFGQQVLDREVSRQIYPDGSSFEHSFPYLQFVVDHFLVYMLLCEEHGERCSEDVPARLRTAMHFIATMLDDNGNFAAIGDDDSGYLMKLWFGEHNNFESLLNTGARLTGYISPVSNADTPDLKTLLLVGDRYPETTPQSEISPTAAEYFDDAGLAVVRTQRPVRLLFVGNSGPLGLAPLAGHGHLDALSFWLSVDGSPIFVDPGTYLYHSGGAWRDYFRSTRAHNTIRIDAMDQARMVADFMYDGFYSIRNASLAARGHEFVWSAEHDGYGKLDSPAQHRRQVTLDTGTARLTIEDHIECDSHHDVEAYFHLHPDCHATTENGGIRIDSEKAHVVMKNDEQWSTIDLIKGDSDFAGGWYSREFNALEKTTSLRLATSISTSTTFVTVIDCIAAQI